jgi:putative spermidine/putrescine transport system substrate-binding protein
MQFSENSIGFGFSASHTVHPGMAHGADSDVVVGTWGGDYQNLLQQYISPLVAKHGTSVVFDTGNAVPRLTKLRAERNSRRSSMDVALLGEVDMFEAARVGALMDVTSANVPNLGNVYKQFKTGYFIPHIFSAMTLVYNTEKFPTPPDSLNIRLDPANKSRVGFSDILFMYSALFVGMTNGGQKVNSFEPGRNFLTELKKMPHAFIRRTKLWPLPSNPVKSG